MSSFAVGCVWCFAYEPWKLHGEWSGVAHVDLFVLVVIGLAEGPLFYVCLYE